MKKIKSNEDRSKSINKVDEKLNEEMISLDIYIILSCSYNKIGFIFVQQFISAYQKNIFMSLGSSRFVHFIILLTVMTLGIECIKRRNLNIVPQSIFAQNQPRSMLSEALNPSVRSCPSCPGPVTIANCDQTEVISGGSTVCKVCKKNFRLHSSRTMCLPVVYYCTNYSKINQNFCTQCMEGYVLSQEDNFCYRTVNNCLMFNYINDTCKRCVDGYELSNNVCNPRPCLSGEYRNLSGLCTQGNIPNCLEYYSPSGDCEICKPTFTLTKNECLPELTCPTITKFSFWILKYGKCLQVTAGCLYIMDDGCGSCEPLYYLIGGKCIPVFFGLTSQTSGDPPVSSEPLNGF